MTRTPEPSPLPPHADASQRGFSRTVSALLASSAYLVPYVLSRSTSPTPDHPRILLWYKTLRQPAIKPPDVVIPLAWTSIETGLAVAGYRLLRQPSNPARNKSLALLGGNVLAIGAWSRLFFGKQDLPAATLASAAMVGAAVAYTAQAARADGVASRAGVPLTAWIVFATVLTGSIWRLNR